MTVLESLSYKFSWEKKTVIVDSNWKLSLYWTLAKWIIQIYISWNYSETTARCNLLYSVWHWFHQMIFLSSTNHNNKTTIGIINNNLPPILCLIHWISSSIVWESQNERLVLTTFCFSPISSRCLQVSHLQSMASLDHSWNHLWELEITKEKSKWKENKLEMLRWKW